MLADGLARGGPEGARRATLHPEQPYIVYNDLPKIDNLKRLMPDGYREKPVLVSSAAASN